MTTWTMEYLMENCWEPGLPFCWLLPLPKPGEVDSEDALWTWQQEKCAICGRGGYLAVDHCHTTGWVRGWLCRGCNISEGKGGGDRGARYRFAPPTLLCGLLGIPYGIGPWCDPDPLELEYGQTLYIGPRDVPGAAAVLAGLDAIPGPVLDVDNRHLAASADLNERLAAAILDVDPLRKG